MKALTFLAITALVCLQVCAAVLHGNQHEHLHKKAVTIKTVTDYTTVTVDAVTMPEVVVWVNGNGDVVSTETRTPGSAATPTIQSSSIPATPDSTTTTTTMATTSVVHTYILHSTSGASALPTASYATPVVAAPATPAAASAQNVAPARVGPAPSSSPSDSYKNTNTNGNGFGIAYDIRDNSNKCKSADAVHQDFELLDGYNLVRIYGVDCLQVKLVTAEAAAHGMKVFCGVGTLDNLAGNLGSIISQAGNNLGVIDTINIGNEVVNNGGAVQDVANAIATARTILGATLYRGSIVTVDTFIAYQNNPSLCEISDYCAINCHAYFDAYTTAASAGLYVRNVAQDIFNAAGKRTVVTESGWPWKGNTNGAAAPSEANQATAMASLKAAFAGDPTDLILFQAFDTQYKDPGSMDVEWYFGIWFHGG